MSTPRCNYQGVPTRPPKQTNLAAKAKEEKKKYEDLEAKYDKLKSACINSTVKLSRIRPFSIEDLKALAEVIDTLRAAYGSEHYPIASNTSQEKPNESNG